MTSSVGLPKVSGNSNISYMSISCPNFSVTSLKGNGLLECFLAGVMIHACSSSTLDAETEDPVFKDSVSITLSQNITNPQTIRLFLPL